MLTLLIHQPPPCRNDPVHASPKLIFRILYYIRIPPFSFFFIVSCSDVCNQELTAQGEGRLTEVIEASGAKAKLVRQSSEVSVGGDDKVRLCARLAAVNVHLMHMRVFCSCCRVPIIFLSIFYVFAEVVLVVIEVVFVSNHC